MPVEHYLARIQEDTTQRQLDLPARAKDLRASLRKILVDARGEGKLKTSQDQILDRVVLLDETKIHRDHDKLWKELKDRALNRSAFCIFGGVKNQGRDPSLSHFERDDGAWFDFSITVRETDGALELLAYDFEIRFASGMGAPFLRFDLNLPDHSNQTARELRSHFHAGSDDLLLPGPMMSPSELCSLFTNGARLPAVRKPRSPTEFEVRWLAQTLHRFSSLRASPSLQQPSPGEPGMTLAQWADLGEDEPGELVDGRLIEEEEVGALHEALAAFLVAALGSWLGARGLVLASGTRFGVSARRGRKPDATVYLAGKKPPAHGLVTTPPDIAIEVVSPRPKDSRRDRVEKMNEYATFGIRSYWIVDPALRSFEIFELDASGRYAKVVGALDGVVENVPGCEGLAIDLDALWALADRLEAEG